MASAFPPPVEPPDEQLVEAARAGCCASWDELVRRHYVPVERSLRRLTNDPEAARDLAQETFLDAFRDLHRLPPDRAFAPWLHRIARNNVLPFWRWRGAERLVSLDRAVEERGDVFAERACPDAMAACEEGALIDQALAGLSPCLRQALLLNQAAGLTAPEIADALGIGRSAAERRVSRAQVEFRRHYLALAGGVRGSALAAR